jgi:uncharacterized membrane protein YqjE
MKNAIIIILKILVVILFMPTFFLTGLLVVVRIIWVLTFEMSWQFSAEGRDAFLEYANNKIEKLKEASR